MLVTHFKLNEKLGKSNFKIFWQNDCSWFGLNGMKGLRNTKIAKAVRFEGFLKDLK